MDETNKSSFDFSNLGGLLFGGNDSGLGDYLSETQKKTMQNQALMSAAMSLLKNSGWTTQPVSIGQALGRAYEAGTAGYQGAQTNAINQILTKQKLDEAKRAQSALDAYQSFITGQPVEGQAITPQQAISAPGMAVGPTVERANLIGQPMSGATMPSAGAALSPQMQKLLSFLPPEKGIPEAIKLMQPQKTTGQPFKAADGKFYVMTETGGVVPAPVAPQVKPTGQPQEAMVAGKPAFVQYYEDGTYKVVSDVAPKTKATGQPFKGADGKFYIQTETGGVIEAPIAPADLAAEEFGAPVTEMVGGQPQRVQYNKYGQRRVVPDAMPYEKPEAEPESIRMLKAFNLPLTIENLRLLDKPEADPEKIKYLKALNMPITLENLRQLDKPEALPNEIQILKLTNKPVTFENVQALRRSGATTVNVNEGQKGFENELSLSKAFKAEPIYKDYNDMKTAYGQVITALDQGTPIGDVAGATKVMKLLDPGSVVRETELAIAMQASGRLDRLQNYFSLWASGQKLTPTQRDDFKQLSAELYAAAGQAYNQKRDEYMGFGKSYGFKNLNTALGDQATLPSIVRKPPAGAAKQKVGRLVTDPKTGVVRYVEE